MSDKLIERIDERLRLNRHGSHVDAKLTADLLRDCRAALADRDARGCEWVEVPDAPSGVRIKTGCGERVSGLLSDVKAKFCFTCGGKVRVLPREAE